MPQNRVPASVPVHRDWLTVAEFAEYLSVTIRTIRTWIAEGKLTAYRTNRLIRVDRADTPVTGSEPHTAA